MQFKNIWNQKIFSLFVSVSDFHKCAENDRRLCSFSQHLITTFDLCELILLIGFCIDSNKDILSYKGLIATE